MKKLVSLVLAVILAMTVCVSVLAAPNGFVESPSNQKGPEVIEGDGIVVTPFGDRDDLPDDVRQTLEDAYNSILNAENLGELSEALEDLANQLNVPIKNLVVSELFNISYENGKEDNEGKFTITLKDDSLGDFFALMKYEDGKWILVDDAKAFDNNKLSFTAGKLPSPFAIVVNSDGTTNSTDDQVPQTGDNSRVFGAVALCAGSVIALAGVYFIFKLLTCYKFTNKQIVFHNATPYDKIL